MKTKVQNYENIYLHYVLLSLLFLVVCLLTTRGFAGESTELGTVTGIIDAPQIINDDPNFDYSAIEIYKFHYNVFQNLSKGPIEISGTAIQPGSIDSVLIREEELVTVNTSAGSFLVQTRENQKQAVTIRKMFSMSGDKVKASDLQKLVCFRITITDNFISQLDWSILGPVNYKVVKQTDKQLIIDVKLDAFASEDAFRGNANTNADGKYVSEFTITVKDRISLYSLNENGQFIYTEW